MRLDENGNVIYSDVNVGTIEGFLFHKNEETSLSVLDDDFKRCMTNLLEEKIETLINEGDAALRIENDFTIRYKGAIVARLKKTEDILRPDLDIIVDEYVQGIALARLALHIQSRIKRQINTALDPLEIIRKIENLSEDGTLFVQRMIEKLGYLPRHEIDNLVKKIQLEERTRLRKAGMRFAQYGVFVRDILKPAAQETKLVLWALFHEFEKMPELPPAGVVTIPYNPDMPEGYYNIAGYKICGDFAVRADMVEKLADAVRPLALKTETNPKAEFEITPQHMSLVGKSGEAFDIILKSLGYDYRLEDVNIVSVAPLVEISENISLKDDIIEENPTVASDMQEDEQAKTQINERVIQKKIWFWAPVIRQVNKFLGKHIKKPKADFPDKGVSQEKHKDNNTQKPEKFSQDKSRSSVSHKTDKRESFKDKKKDNFHKRDNSSKSQHSEKKPSVSEPKPYVNMPKRHKVEANNNPFAILSSLKK